MSTSILKGRAAWSDSIEAAFVIREAPDWPVGDDEIKIRIRAAAINPADPKSLDSRVADQEWPVIFGFDGAGEVVETGKDVQTFVKGDRVAALLSSVFGSLGNTEAAFQEYAVVNAKRAFKIPERLSFADGAVLPAASATAAVGLFAPERLNLKLPGVQKASPNRKVLLVWGGSSSVGAAAVQLASHAGYEVFATAGRKNFDLVKSIGASQVFDYKDVNVIDDIVAALKGRENDYVGAYSSTQDGLGLPPAVHVAAGLGLKDSMVACTNPRVTQEGLPEGVKVVGNVYIQAFKALGPALPGHPEIGEAIFGHWLPEWLAAGTVKVTLPAKVVGQGLDVVGDAVDIVRKGQNSGEKIVVTL